MLNRRTHVHPHPLALAAALLAVPAADFEPGSGAGPPEAIRSQR